MLKFNEFIKESHDVVIQVDSRSLASNLDQINAELDALTSKPYQNAPILLAQLRGCLERYGILIPASATNHFLDLGSELVYLLGDSPNHLYIVYDTKDDGFVDAYAQIVSEDELNDLLGMDSSNLIYREPHGIKFRKSTWYAPRDDDSGNDDEY